MSKILEQEYAKLNNNYRERDEKYANGSPLIELKLLAPHLGWQEMVKREEQKRKMSIHQAVRNDLIKHVAIADIYKDDEVKKYLEDGINGNKIPSNK